MTGIPDLVDSYLAPGHAPLDHWYLMGDVERHLESTVSPHMKTSRLCCFS